MSGTKFNFGGKERGFKLGLGTLGDVMEYYDTDMLGLGRKMVKNQFSVTPTILYYAHFHHCRREELPVDFTIYDFQDWLEEMEDPMNNKGIEDLLSIFIENLKKFLPKSKPEEKSKGNEDEKKS